MKNRNSLKKCVLKHRFSTLVVMAAFGAVLVLAVDAWVIPGYEFFLKCSDPTKCSNSAAQNSAPEKFFASLYVIALGLPTLAMLWFFRTHDTREQIAKAAEGTHANIFVNATKMLSDQDKHRRVIAMVLLMDLRRQGFYQQEIDLMTQRVDLSETDLSGVLLREADLSGATLVGAQLPDADLTNTNLNWAKLSHANLKHANLRNANLYRAQLDKTDLTGAKLQGADLREAYRPNAKFEHAEHYQTLFPEEFSPDKEGMISKKA